VRLELEFKDTFEVGDILTSYQNIGYPKIVLENGADYKVVSATKEKNGLRQGIVGYNLTLVDMDDELNKLYLFFPDVNAPENQTILSKLLELATKVNSYHSTPRDYAMYKSLKDKLMMITNVYEYPRNSSHFYSERELKDKEPLLFTVVNTVAGNKQLEEKLELLYGSIVKDRANDDKIVGEGETFASAFCIFEKDLDYGYACTAHKSQGSTMDTVFVDELNFDRMKNRINDRTGIMENKVKERNQLKYVAFTRASTELYIMV
jgi:deoxyadenosine/deoxycytidine kinase